MTSILFVCTANLYRSPLAAAFFSRALRLHGQEDHWAAESAGTWAAAGRRPPRELVDAAQAAGIDLTQHIARRVDRTLVARYDLIIVMEKGHREALRVEFPAAQQKIYLLSEVADRLEYNIADPAATGMQIEQLIEEMSALIERAFPQICRLAQGGGMGLSPSTRHVNHTL